ncbi:F0F1 ATP synthase subunit epsilon [filamentous cyanobacterium LEGE 11480]|uniref:ATP synthase epsilon chain n=1 Tax=Romeriopsis navalis LEGE 11480 TaxID=2777977 RepID=A0A928Z587_9CYAN|nr:ATP synthase F1 subunit epsilon [Romeriopsis navalis]MBE9030995.1 F0F1 ATP synthase subunit epsilon [Romeriopsis navalis LEGE 11480]
MALTVRIIAPDKTVWDAESDEVILPSTTGQLGILSGHAPMLTALETGVLRVRGNDKTWVPIALMGGFAEIENNEVTVLVNAAEMGDSINLDEAKNGFTEAEARFLKAQNGTDREELFTATQAYKRARARVQAAGGNA